MADWVAMRRRVSPAIGGVTPASAAEQRLVRP